MKILMLLQKAFPPDIRVEKEAKSLIKAGYEVHIICKNSQNKTDGIYNGIKIHRIKPRSKINIFNKIINFPIFINPFWLFQVYHVIKKNKIQLIHAHDLPMAPLALLVKREGFKVIYDMHENYPEALRLWEQKSIFLRILKDPDMAHKIERIVLRRVDYIIVVVEEQKQRLIKLNLPESKVTIVGNRVEIDEFLNFPLLDEILKKYKSKFILLYAGSFASDRGLEVPILAMKQLRKHISDIHLLLVGDGPNRKELEKLARSIEVNKYIDFIGWQPFQFMPSYIYVASVCLIPQPSNPFINTTVPHKLFQYMALRKPVVVSNATPLARWVKELDAGEIFQSGDVQDFENVILNMKSLNDYYNNCRKSIDEKIDWREDAKQLIELYQKISSYILNYSYRR